MKMDTWKEGLSEGKRQVATIILAKIDREKPQCYDGGYDLERLKKWIMEQSWIRGEK